MPPGALPPPVPRASGEPSAPEPPGPAARAGAALDRAATATGEALGHAAEAAGAAAGRAARATGARWSAPANGSSAGARASKESRSRGASPPGGAFMPRPPGAPSLAARPAPGTAIRAHPRANLIAESPAISHTAPETSRARPAIAFTAACTMKPSPIPVAIEKVKAMASAVTIAGM